MKTFVIPVGGLMMALMMATGCGDDSTGDCTPNDHTACMQDITYWMDSCGDQGLVAEICDCGCNVDFTGCDQSCSCTADCTGRVCGDDGCGGTCGGCNSGEACTTAGQCIVCTPDCAGRECGDNGCQGLCGTCDTGETCNTTGQCVTGCTPDCTGFECGDDGCGGSCGDCQPDETCSAAGQCDVTLSDVLVFTNCNVPFVLDITRVSDAVYSFPHLVQEYCVAGGYDGNNINLYDEKMYYGVHEEPPGTMISFSQVSMSTPPLNPEWTVKVDFSPDTDFVSGSIWNASIGGLNPPEAYVGLIRHTSTSSMCLKAIGTTGNLTVTNAVDCTLFEGGSFTLNGQVLLTDPWAIQDYCSQTPANLPCCP